MAVNSSSSSLNYLQQCSNSTASLVMSMAYIITRFFLLLPLSFFVLYLGQQRWRQQRSFTTSSHSDVFTYHSVATEMIYALGITVLFVGQCSGLLELTTVGFYLSGIVLPGQTSFHILTCVERYLAVVHPITYLGLRQSGGVRIRNVSIGCVWLLCFGWMGVTAWYFPEVPYVLYFSFLASCLIVATFCSLSVLRVLIRPAPGETSGYRVRVDLTKQRAFYTIMAILGVLWISFFGYLVCLALVSSHVQNYIDQCLVLISGNLVSLPSSLVLPLLFLHRGGKLLCCRCSNE